MSPIYDFLCPREHRWEDVLLFSEVDAGDERGYPCPECGEIGQRIRVHLIEWHWSRKARLGMSVSGSAQLRKG